MDKNNLFQVNRKLKIFNAWMHSIPSCFIFFCIWLDEKKEIYFMALIDILTQYGLKKRSANVAKTVKYGDQEISTVKPEQYSKRFLEFINKIVV